MSVTGYDVNVASENVQKGLVSLGQSIERAAQVLADAIRMSR